MSEGTWHGGGPSGRAQRRRARGTTEGRWGRLAVAGHAFGGEGKLTVGAKGELVRAREGKGGGGATRRTHGAAEEVEEGGAARRARGEGEEEAAPPRSSWGRGARQSSQAVEEVEEGGAATR